MTAEHKRIGHETRIGPSPKQRERDQTKALDRQLAQAREDSKRRKEQEADLKERYGEDLIDFGGAYFGPDIAGWVVVVRGERISRDEVRPKFTQALVDVMENQPVELKGEWLNIFLKEITDFSKG